MDEATQDAEPTAKQGDGKRKRKAVPERWHRFRILDPESGLAILRGSTSTIDKRFKLLSRGRQASAACAIALVYAHLFEPKDWLASFVDRAIEYGDRLHRMSRARNHLDEDVYVTPSLLLQEFFVGDYKCKVCTEAAALFGSLFCEAAGPPNLATGLRNFLDPGDFGILTTQGVSVAIWSAPPSEYFYFDPAPTDEQGLRCPLGYGCLMRATRTDDILGVLLANLNDKCDSKYCIDRVKLVKVKPIGRGKYQSQNADDVTIDKRVLQTINPADLEDAKLDCTKVVPKTAAMPDKRAGKAGKKAGDDSEERIFFDKV